MPLAIGITHQIAGALGMDTGEQRRLGRILGRWCGTMRYLHSFWDEGAVRCGLNGLPVEPVDPEHQRFARERLYRRRLEYRRQERRP